MLAWLVKEPVWEAQALMLSQVLESSLSILEKLSMEHLTHSMNFVKRHIEVASAENHLDLGLEQGV